MNNHSVNLILYRRLDSSTQTNNISINSSKNLNNFCCLTKVVNKKLCEFSCLLLSECLVGVEDVLTVVPQGHTHHPSKLPVTAPKVS